MHFIPKNFFRKIQSLKMYMTMKKYISYTILLCQLHAIFAYQLKSAPLLTKRPHWLKACRKNDQNVGDCLNELFKAMFPELAKGIPELNVDPFEPLPLNKISVSKGNGAITLTGSLYDLIVSGPSNSTPTYTEFNLDKRLWNFGLNLPLLKIKSQYNLKGKILVLPLIGHGTCDLRLFDVNTRVTTNITLPVVEGKQVVKIDQMKVNYKVGQMKVTFNNLFNGNRVLGQTVNAFINQHGPEIMDDLQESIGASLAEIFTDIVNNVFTKIPIDLWLLDDQDYAIYLKNQNK